MEFMIENIWTYILVSSLVGINQFTTEEAYKPINIHRGLLEKTKYGNHSLFLLFIHMSIGFSSEICWQNHVRPQSGQIITTSLFSRSLESWLRFGKSSQVAQHFRLVKYYNLPSTSFPWSITIFVALIGFTPGKTGPSLPLGWATK